MSLSTEQIRRIQERLPGWEKDWDKLCVILLGEDGQSGALVRAVNALPIHWPSEQSSPAAAGRSSHRGPERDDFIATMMYHYHRRAKRGTLLSNYDPQLSDVVSFLTSRHILRTEAIKFLRKLGNRKLQSLNKGESGEHNQPPAPPAPSAELTQLIFKVQLQLERTPLQGTNRVTRVAEQAGIQLYPRLDWSQPGMNQLRAHLMRVVCASPEEGDAHAALCRAHAAAEQSFRKRLERLAAKIYNQGKGVSLKRREALATLQGTLYFQQIFMPLDARALVDLLGIKLADAAQRRHRYRAALPQLLPGLGEYYEALREHRAAAERGNPP